MGLVDVHWKWDNPMCPGNGTSQCALGMRLSYVPFGMGLANVPFGMGLANVPWERD